MTVKTELERLKKQRDVLKKDRSRLLKERDELLSQETRLQRKGEELLQKKSSLAQTLQVKNQKELEEIQRKIEAKNAEFIKVRQELERTQGEIDAWENDTTLYIQEQVHLMVPKFLEWVEKNKEAIGDDITRSFYIKGVVAWNNAYDVDCYTGDVGIFEESKDPEEEFTCIVSSENFYFKQICSRVEDNYMGRTVEETDWYAQYLEDFTKALLEGLEASYNLGEELQLTIESPDFTLELV